MSMGHYRKQFAEKLGFVPYGGTLNIRLSPLSSKAFSSIKRRRGISIKGPAKGGKAVEMARCYPTDLYGTECAIVVPKLSKHKGVAEIISAKRLRSTLKLRDGSRITVVVRV
jgi:riboflavin kinase, archaea type